MRSFLLRLLLPALLCLMAGASHAAATTADGFVAVPPLSAHVIDQAGMLDAQQRAALDGVLADYETRTGSQIAVLLVASTAPEAIEQYSIRVADAWKLGRKGVDDGVILLVARDNPKALRRLRIEAGRGVQGSLTDAQSKRILQDVIAPHFRQDDFYGGLAAGVSAISSLLDQESLPAPTPHNNDDDEDGWIVLGLIVLFLVVSIFLALRSRRHARNNLNDNDWGHSAGVIIGAILDQAARSSSGSSGRSGGFSGSGSSGGGFSSGGGSFSGGGGSFDGGGASGDW